MNMATKITGLIVVVALIATTIAIKLWPPIPTLQHSGAAISSSAAALQASGGGVLNLAPGNYVLGFDDGPYVVTEVSGSFIELRRAKWYEVVGFNVQQWWQSATASTKNKPCQSTGAAIANGNGSVAISGCNVNLSSK
jgi:hypothetical protein